MTPCLWDLVLQKMIQGFLLQSLRKKKDQIRYLWSITFHDTGRVQPEEVGPSSNTSPSGHRGSGEMMICNREKPNHAGVNRVWHMRGPSHTRIQKHFCIKSVWAQLRAFFSLFMGHTGFNSCELANVRCPAAQSDGKHMSTEVERQMQSQSSLDSVTIQWRGEEGCRHIFRPSCISLSSCQQWVACFSYFPETVLAVQQGQQKKSSFSLQGAFGSKNL